MSNVPPKTSGWNPSPTEYIEVNRHKRSRFEIDSHLLNFGHDPAEIEAAWKLLSSKKRRKGWLLRRDSLEFGFRIILLGFSFVTLLAVSNGFIPTYWGALLYFKTIGSLFFAGLVLLILSICILLDYRVNYPYNPRNSLWRKNVVIALVSCLLSFLCILFISVNDQHLVDAKGFDGKTYYADATIGNGDGIVFLSYRIIECDSTGVICKILQKDGMPIYYRQKVFNYSITFDPMTGKPTISASKD